jgi:hypothetical protein
VLAPTRAPTQLWQNSDVSLIGPQFSPDVDAPGPEPSLGHLRPEPSFACARARLPYASSRLRQIPRTSPPCDILSDVMTRTFRPRDASRHFKLVGLRTVPACGTVRSLLKTIGLWLRRLRIPDAQRQREQTRPMASGTARSGSVHVCARQRRQLLPRADDETVAARLVWVDYAMHWFR